MVPPGEHLEADDFARGEVHLRLEKGQELAVLEAVADALFDLALGEQRALHSSVEPDGPGNSSAARTIHRNIGAPDDVGDAHLGRRSRRDAGESADLDDPLFERERPSDCAKHAVGGRFGPVDFRRAALSATANSSPLRRPITTSGPSSSNSALAIDFQQAVAGLIAMLIVDRLEALHLEGNDDQVAPARLGRARTAP